MKKASDRDFLSVLQSLETILQAQTKISKHKPASNPTPNIKQRSPNKREIKKKANKTDTQHAGIKNEIRRLTQSPPKTPRKLYKSNINKEKRNDANLSSFKRSTKNQNSSPKIQDKAQLHQPMYYSKPSYYTEQSPSPSKHKIRHNSPSEQVFDESDDQHFRSNYTPSQLNTLCIFFLRWMKKCTEKIEAEAKLNVEPKVNQQTEKQEVERKIDDKLIELIELNQDIQPISNPGSPPLAESNEISIERINCTHNVNQIIDDKIEINAKPKAFNSNLSSSIKSETLKEPRKKNAENKKTSFTPKVSFSPMLTPQQEKQYLDYLQPNNKQRHIQKKQKKVVLKNTNENTVKANSKNNINDSDNNSNNTLNESNNINNRAKNNINIKDNNNSTNNSNITNDKNFLIDSVDETSKLDLEGTSPLPISNDAKKMPSIGESDLNNHPNSDDIHYDSYELSEKSLSLLPPQGEGEVTEFNPSNFM